MALGLAVFLIVLGLVMATGVASYDLALVADTTLGWLLLAAGLVTLAIGLVGQQQERVRERHRDQDGRRR